MRIATERIAGGRILAFETRGGRVEGSESGVTSVAFTVPSADAFPGNMAHTRRALQSGQLARSWVAWTDASGLRVLDLEHDGAVADPTAFVPALSAATRTAVVLGSGAQTATQVATSIAAALVLDGVGATSDGATVTITGVGVTDLVIPDAVDMTDTSLRGMWGMQRDDWGEGFAGQTLNSDGGTNATVWMNLGTLPAAGRISGAYAWCNTSGAPCTMRLVVGTGPAYSLTPGPITIIGQGVVTSDAVTGFATIAFESVAVGAAEQIWVGHATDTATAGLRYRTQVSTPLGSGDVPAAQNILVDTTRSPASTNAFGATETPTVNSNFALNSAMGVIFEIPDGSGNYPADGSLTARIGDQNTDPDHGTQFPVPPATIDGETTGHRQSVLPWTSTTVVSVTRTIGDTASGEDCRVALYEHQTLLFPAGTAPPLIADLGPLGITAGTGNRAVTLTLGTPEPIGSDVVTGPHYALHFNYCTASGAALATMVLPVYVDSVGDSGWLNCWEDVRGAWHDDIRGASEYATASGVTEYRTRLSEGNTGMPTTIITDPWPDPLATDVSDDSPPAIALDWMIVTRAGITAA